MMRTRLIVPSSLLATPDGLAVTIRLPWYRTLPLSVIDMPVLRIDGAAVDADRITLTLNGQSFDRHSITLAADVWWYVLDPATLHVAGLAMPDGGAHAITVEVAFAPPYIPEITLFCAATRTMQAEMGSRPV